MKTIEPGSKSIIGLGRSKQAVEKHMSDLRAVSERNVDFAGVECQLPMGPKRSVFKKPHEDLEQSFCAEIAKVVKHLKTVKETTGNKRIMQTAERVERSEDE